MNGAAWLVDPMKPNLLSIDASPHWCPFIPQGGYQRKDVAMGDDYASGSILASARIFIEPS